jgi:hypothetical protein
MMAIMQLPDRISDINRPRARLRARLQSFATMEKPVEKPAETG